MENISPEQQKVIFKEYYNFKNVERQKEMLCNFVGNHSVARVSKRKENSSLKKSVSRSYYLIDAAGEKFCLLRCFLQTFFISKTVVDNAVIKQYNQKQGEGFLKTKCELSENKVAAI